MASDPALESDICVACGLCCDGTLFSHAPLRPDEVERARQRGFAVGTPDQSPRFNLGCVHLCGTKCGVYPDRPHVCGDFKCVNLNAMIDGQITPDEARKRITQARAAATKAKAQFLPGESFRDARIRLHHATTQPPTAQASPLFRLHLGALELILDKYFRAPSTRVFKADEKNASASMADDSR